MTDSNERLNSAIDGLNAQEDYVRSLRHLSDDELRGQLVDTLRKEKAVVDRWIDSGDCFILSAAGKVHLPSCPSMRALVDREAAWAPYLDDLERARDWHGSDNAPPMPALLTRGAELIDQLDAITRNGLVLAPETVAAIGRAEARRNRWMTVALWVIAGLLGWVGFRLID